MPDKNPYDTASFISRLFFLWPNDLITAGASKTLSQDDLPPICEGDVSASLNAKLSYEWKQEVQHKAKPSLLRAMFRTFSKHQVWLGVILCVESGVKIIQAILLGFLVRVFVSAGDSDIAFLNNGYIVSALITICGIIVGLIHHQYFFISWHFGIKMQVALTTIIYDKAVQLSLSSLAHTATGHIVNLSSQDVEAMQQAGVFLHWLYIPILEAAAILAVGLLQFGVSFLAGFGTVILLVPLQSFISRLLTRLRTVLGSQSDYRIKLTNQALAAARLMKINGWEWKFRDSIGLSRQQEMSSLRKISYLKAGNEAFFFAAPVLVGCFTFITYVQTGGHLNPGDVFTVLTLFSMLQFSLTKFFPYSVQFLSQAYVAIKRTERLLLLKEFVTEDAPTKEAEETIAVEEIQPLTITNEADTKDLSDDNVRIKLADFSATWGNVDGETTAKSPLVLSNINLEVHEGELIVVVGPVGSSKSSLLMAILQELTPSKGCVAKKGKIAYCAQEPWIMSSTVKKNIMFDEEFDDSRYSNVLQGCDLTSDLKILPAGDGTVIGDRGVNLSGGQRARVGLARAVYAAADIYLLDDPLSAVDPKVANILFQQAICGLLRNKTRILITHQVQFLSSSSVSRVLVLENGHIRSLGTYQQLRESGDLDWLQEHEQQRQRSRMGSSDSMDKTPRMRALSSVDSLSDRPCEEVLEHAIVSMPNEATVVDGDDECGVELSSIPQRRMGDKGYSVISYADAVKDDEPEATVDAGITVEEDRNIGTVSLATYLGYFKHMGGFIAVILMMICMMSAQVFVILSTVWLARWSRMDSEEQRAPYNTNFYVGIVILALVTSILRSIVTFEMALKAAVGLHNAMLVAVLRAPVLFFDSNPIGRILNRFSKDLGFVDDMLPMTFYDFFQCFFMVIGAVVVVCIGAPIITIVLIPIVPFFIYLRNYFLRTSREVKRLDALARSPLFSHISESLDGLTTIRAYGKLKEFQIEHKRRLDAHTRASFSYISSARWLGFRLDVIVVVLLAASTFGAVIALNYNIGGDPAALSAGVMYVMQLAGLFQWCVRQSAEVENYMVSVERLISYGNVESESALHGPKDISNRPKWPEHGHIEGRRVVCTYRKGTPPVLRGITFTMYPGQRVGVVGRTGAGKSTLISALLRLMEISDGSIMIDGVNISEIGLHDLRPKISVIPQTPFLFSGTIRENMDAFHKYTDAEIWNAFDCVQLREVIEHLSDGLGLQGLVAENGSNFSVGERQLVCLARAILQRNKILIMDEATANVDLETDKKVQEAIRKQFRGNTVIMVAHRILTVIDCDQIMVMASGELMEVGHPHELLSKYLGEEITNVSVEMLQVPPKNSFASMVLETGPSMTYHLRKLAEEAYNMQQRSRHNSE